MIPMGPLPPIFRAIGAIKTFFQTYSTAIQIALFVAQGVSAHKAAMKAKRTGAEILLQKYGTGSGMPVIYGTRRVAGTVVYMNTINNKELFVVYAIAGHEIDSFDLESLQIDGRTIKDTKIYRQGYDISDGSTRINFRPSGETRASGTFWGNTSTERANITGGANTGDNARMTFNCHKGTTTQAADPMLEGIISEWTSNHKLTGITYIAANYEYDIQGMFTGIPNLTVVVNGKKVYDPRTATTGFSSNPALCLLDYLTDDEYGKGLSLSDDIDSSSFSTAANDCDTSADTITHSSIVVENANTNTDRLIIANANEDDYNNFKVGNKFTISDGVTTYVSDKKLIDKDTSLIDIDGTNPVATLQLTFETGAVGTAITSNTTCAFTETQIRFDCNGVLDTDETVLENTKLLVANLRGIFTYAGGKYSIKVEGTESSVVSLDEDDILESGITLSLENKEAKYNKVEAEFYNAQKKYETDTTYYTGETSDTFLSDDGNEVLETRIQLPFCTNQRIAYNHAKAMLKRSRSQKTISFVATPKVLKAKVGEVISITNTNLNLSSEQYRITNMVINPDLNISVNAIEYQTAVYDYVTPPDEEIGIGQDPVDGYRVEAPSSLTFTNKNATTGEAAKLTWTDSSKYPSYEFRVQIIDGVKTRYDRRVKDTTFYLDGISVANGYTAKVSAINALGVESDTTDITVNVTTAPVTTPDIEQGSVGGFNFTTTKMYYGTAGNFNNTDTAVYFDNAGQFSLKDKLSWNGTTLDISGNLTVENTITADKIVVDGINLDNLISATTQSGSIYLTEFTGIKIATAGATNGYPALLRMQDDQGTNCFTDITQSQTGINIRARANTNKGTIRFQGIDSGITPVNYGGFDASGNFEIGSTDVITASRDMQNISRFFSDSVFQFFTSGGSAQNIRVKSVFASTSYNDVPPAGSINATNTYELDGTTVIDNSRNLTNIGTISANNLTFDGATLEVIKDGATAVMKVHEDAGSSTARFHIRRGTVDTFLQHRDSNFEIRTENNISTSNTPAMTIDTGGNIVAGYNLSVSGNLTVSGTTTTIDTTNLDVKDKNITLNYGAGDTSSNANGAGITIQDAVNSTTDATILWDATDDNFEISHGLDFGDNSKARFGTGEDLQIYHNGTDSVIDNLTGDLYITNKADDEDIIIRTDNGSGGFTTYMQFDGSATEIDILQHVKLPDGKAIYFGTGNDLNIFHSGSNSFIDHIGTGSLYVRNTTDDSDIIFQSDDGSGGLAEYFRVDGGSSNVLFSKALKLSDSVSLQIGDNNDFQLSHNGTNTFMANNTGIFYITQNTDDANFLLRADNGSGGVANYVVLKGSTGEVLLNHYGNNRFKTTADGVNVMNGGLYFAGTQVITSARNLVNVGTISSGAITASTGDVSSIPLSIGSGSNTNYTLQRWITSAHSGTSAYMIAYGASHGSQANHFAMKNVKSGGEIFFELFGVEPLRLTSTGATFAGTISSGAITSSGAMTINEGNAFTDLNIKSDRTSGNIGGVNFVNASNVIKGQVFGNTDGTVYFYSGGQTEALRLDSSQNATFAGDITSSGDIRAVDVNISGSLQNTVVPAEASVKINERGYADGTTYFRDLDIFDGKGNQFVKFDGSTQRVGIGTTAPSFELDVEGNIGMNGNLYHNGDHNTYIGFTADTQTFRTGGTDRVTINNTGVGIGTTSPIYLLSLSDSDGADLGFSNSSTLSDGDYLGRIYGTDSSNNFFTGINMFYHDSNDGEMRFRIKTAGTNTDVMTLVDGNVGIGTTSPDYSLDVRAASNVLFKLASTSASNNARMVFAPNNAIKWNMGVNIADNAFTWFDQDTNTSPVRFEVGAATNTLVVDSNSRVGIGTNSPAANLHVESSAPEFRLSQSGTAKVRLRTSGDNYINTGQDLGIGTNSPSQKLHVAGNILTTGGATIGDSSADALTFFGILKQGGSGGTTVIDSSRNLTNIGTISSGNITSFTNSSTSSSKFGRSAGQEIEISTNDLTNAIKAVQDSDSNGDHNFNLNREFAGSGANNFNIQKAGTNQLSIDTNANATFAGKVYLSGQSATDISVDGTYFEITTASGYTRIGAGNTSYSHFYTDRPQYYFNKFITVDGGIFNSYNEDAILRRAGSSSNQITIGSTAISATLPFHTTGEGDSIGHAFSAEYYYDETVGDSDGADTKWTLIQANGNVCTSTTTGKVYRVRLVTLGTGTNTGSVWLADNVDGAGWRVKAVSVNATASESSNYPKLEIDNNVPKVSIEHTSAYSVRIFVEEYDTGNNGGMYTIFGTDALLTYANNGARIGINKENPAQRLDVNGTIGINGTEIITTARNLTNIGTISSGAITSSNILTVDYTAPIIRLKPDNGAFFQLRANESPARLELGHSSNKNLYLSNTGNATFNYDLNVVSNFKINGTTVIDSSRNLTNIGTISSGAITSSGTEFILGSGSISTKIKTINASGFTETAFEVYSSGAYRERIRIGNGGSVGIGTASPSSSQKLDVAGKIRASQDITITNGDLIVNTESKGIRMLSANGTEYLVFVNNSGQLVVEEQ